MASEDGLRPVNDPADGEDDFIAMVHDIAELDWNVSEVVAGLELDRLADEANTGRCAIAKLLDLVHRIERRVIGR